MEEHPSFFCPNWKSSDQEKPMKRLLPCNQSTASAPLTQSINLRTHMDFGLKLQKTPSYKNGVVTEESKEPIKSCALKVKRQIRNPSVEKNESLPDWPKRSKENGLGSFFLENQPKKRNGHVSSKRLDKFKPKKRRFERVLGQNKAGDDGVEGV
ncbi:hypothetical protein PanWU01x14_273740 [Parasponia andersonii]|uniref:Uncharacterized protein n=1 Tax=Parasponia andersonii TaxID=3476 RepID=A0A2P5B3R8_PARAD|nr:hypothetical protein PanWU01x14_273740 [Parasponia andersonii]